MSRPLVSVVMAVYNGAATVAQAARSVLEQSYADYEFLIVDDGSTDGTGAVLETLARGDARVKPIRLPRNVGRSAARNEGINAARGAYVAVIDADDHWMPDRLSRQVEFMEARPKLTLCGAWGIIDKNGRELEWRQPEDPEAVKRSILWINPFIHCSVLIRREALREAGGYDAGLHFSEDYDLYLRLLRRGAGANVPEFLVRYRYNADPRYRLRDDRGKLRVRWRALWRYGYPKTSWPCLLAPALTALLPLRLTLWLKSHLGRS